LHIVETATGRLLATLTGPPGRVNAVAFGPDGRTLAAATTRRTVRVYHLPTGQELAVLDSGTVEPIGVWFALGGRGVVALGRFAPRALLLWDPAAP
jgi:WD40 repeat protein